MTSTDGQSVRIDGPVQFRPSFSYSGYGRVCRVEIIPALNSDIKQTPNNDLRFVSYRPGRWFVFFSQFGVHHWIKNSIDTTDLGNFVDVAAFHWRKRRTTTYWMRNPMEIWDTELPNEPYGFDFDYDARYGELILKETGYVYFIEAVGMNRVRVGWTANPKRRPNELVRFSPSPLNLMALLPGGRSDELHLQLVLTEWRLHDDWFTLNSATREYIQMLQRRWRTPGDYPVMKVEVHEPVGAQGVPTESNQ